MIGTAISLFHDVVTGGSAVSNIYKVVSGIIRGDKTEQYLKQVAEHVSDMRVHIERLSDNVLYAADLQAVRDVTQNRQRVVDNLREVRESLEPLSQATGQEILSSAMIWTPDKMQKAMHKNPWDVLQHICPLQHAGSVTHPDMVPVLFEDPDSHVQYIGWQKHGMLLPAFDCEYDELWMPRQSEGSIPLAAPKVQSTLPPVENIHGWSVNKVQALQQRTAQALGLPLPFRDRLADGGEGPEMVIVPAGEFLMGSPKFWDDIPQHPVIIEQPFLIGRYTVTFEEYKQFLQAKTWFGATNPHEKPDDMGWGQEKNPVINVSWYDAMAYVDWLSGETGQQYRLPTEAEWEYAARAGTITPFYFGNELTRSQANYGGSTFSGVFLGNSKNKTLSVGQYPPNAWGLHDMHGNVKEWTCSKYTRKNDGSEQRCAESEDRSERIVRGGSWYCNEAQCRSYYSEKIYPNKRDKYLGFRLVRQ